MKKVFSYGVIVSILFVLAILISFTSSENFNKNQSLDTGLDITIQKLDGTEIQLSSFKGNEVIVDFFATWCVPCEAQARLLQRINIAYPDITIISVSVDLNDDIPKLQEYQAKTNITWLFGRDIDLKANDLYGTYTLPTIAHFDENGNLINLKNSVATYSEIENWILNPDEYSESSSFYLFGLELSSTIGLPLFLFVGLYVALSPCLFPIMPITILNIMNKQNLNSRDPIKESLAKIQDQDSLQKPKRITAFEWVFLLWSGILFAFGIFALIGVFIGQALVQNYILLNFLFGVILITMGYIIIIPRLEMTIFSRIPVPNSIQNQLHKENYSGIDLFILGIVYSIIALPCSGPVFIALLPLVISFNNILISILSLGFFAIGLFIPYFALIMLASEAQTKFIKGVRARYNVIKNVTGILIILVGGLLVWPYFGGPLLFAIG